MKTARQMIRDWRVAHDLTQQQIAERTKLRPQKVSAYETGLTRVPADAFLNIIVNGFGVTPENFFIEQASKSE